VERAHLRLSSGVKLNRFRDFAFTCRRVGNTDSHKCVRGREVTIGELLFKHLDKRQTPSAKITNFISFEHVFGPRVVPKVDEFIFHAIRNILDWNNKTIFHQIQVWFDDFGKLQHKFLTKPSKVLNNFRCYINIRSITSRRGKILEQAKFPAWAFRFQLSSFFTNALRCQWNRRLSSPFFVVSN